MYSTRWQEQGSLSKLAVVLHMSVLYQVVVGCQEATSKSFSGIYLPTKGIVPVGGRLSSGYINNLAPNESGQGSPQYCGLLFGCYEHHLVSS